VTPVLPPREAQVVALIAAGKTTKEIAQQLDLGRSTVEQYRERAKRRLGARNSPHLVALALEGAR
jgi:DNA-binding CsgD family transcriptional regulator